jgi:hypothetical protein
MTELLDDYWRLESTIVPFVDGGKKAIVRGWQEWKWQPADSRPGMNVGMILGRRSGLI